MKESIIKNRILALRELMKREGLFAYLIPTTDYHGSEYVNSHFHAREYMSGFTGSAGDLLITMNEAFLWTDSRYFLQAKEELEGSEIKLMKSGRPHVPSISQWLKDNCKGTLGFDARLISAKKGLEYSEITKLRTDIDLVDEIWTTRPSLISNRPYPIPETVTGESASSKLARVRKSLANSKADYHLMTSLDDIAWLNNLRGSDVEYTPVFYSFELISKDYAKLYLLNEDVYPETLNLADGVSLHPYWQVFEDIANLPEGTLRIDEDFVSYSFYSMLPKEVKVQSGHNPAEIFKSMKNQVEIASTKNAHLKDGIAMVNFLYWLKSNIGVLPITELSASDYLETQRRMQPGYLDLSFETICGYGANGAIVHYAATPSTNARLQSMGFVLIDSGAHYEDGTTDITRTVALGPLSDTMRRRYTAVLKGHIHLAMAKYDRNTSGADLDKIARGPLEELGLNYGHGTGHGVGHILSVHEGPQWLSPRGQDQCMLPGMITSDEPGCYIEGEYGIRLENEMLSVEDGDQMAFETITLCPFDKDAIIFEELTDEELKWLVDYHQKVYDTLSPHLEPLERQWLKQQTIDF